MPQKPLALGIIGHPIGHTLSPLLHNFAGEYLKIPLNYSAFDVDPSNLENAMDGVRALGIDGLNVTIPHKREVMKYLDDLTDTAQRIGAVNTITREGGKLIGHNTDSYGFLQSIRENAGVDNMSGKKIVVYGAGGAARAVLFALAKQTAATIVIVNRTEANAVTLAVDIVSREPMANIKTAGFGDNNLVELVASADIIVNTTPLGMYGSMETPPGAEMIHDGQLAVDIVYRPLVTPFLDRAESAGAKTLDGLWMLIHQGAEAFRLWTGEVFPVKEARTRALEEL